MTQGFLVFAHDNEQIEYGLMALYQAKRIREILSKPVSIVLDSRTQTALDNKDVNWRTYFDQVINQESVATQTKRYGTPDNQLTFHNLDRIDAYQLSPYDETILIDTDILIQTDRLNKLWNHQEDLLVCDTCSTLYGERTDEFKWVSDRSIKFYWATVCYFKKTEFAKMFFEHCQWVKQNYGWLSYVYELPNGPVRNDFVWSIALHNLKHPAPTIPFNLMYSTYDDTIINMSQNTLTFLTPNGVCKIVSDVHMFNKRQLLEFEGKL
jgi:hypothetical protein